MSDKHKCKLRLLSTWTIYLYYWFECENCRGRFVVNRDELNKELTGGPKMNSAFTNKEPIYS